MQPPWSTLNFFLILITISNKASSGLEKYERNQKNGISFPFRVQQEPHEKEKRLIPYKTYYLAPDRTNPIVESKQNFYLPLLVARTNTITAKGTDGPTNLIQNNDQQQINVFPSSVVGLQNPLHVSSAPSVPIKEFTHENKPDNANLGIVQQIYQYEPITSSPVDQEHTTQVLTQSQQLLERPDEFNFQNRNINKILQNQAKNNYPQPLVYPNRERLPRLRVPQENEIRFVVNVTPVLAKTDSTNYTPSLNHADGEDEKESYENAYGQSSIGSFLSILKETNKLPKNLTPNNIDNGIKTLALILERLQREKQIQKLQGYTLTGSAAPKGSADLLETDDDQEKKIQSFPQASGTSTPGKPGIDYPIYSSIPQTKFDCSTQRYKGFFGDPDTNCQVWHYCDLNGGQASFLCPNGTIFSQVALTCDWWFNVKCASTSQLYVLNERLYKYILPFSPSFPEDYSGPIVDRYLTAKFNELERKSKTKALKSPTTTAKP